MWVWALLVVTAWSAEPEPPAEPVSAPTEEAPEAATESAPAAPDAPPIVAPATVSAPASAEAERTGPPTLAPAARGPSPDFERRFRSARTFSVVGEVLAIAGPPIAVTGGVLAFGAAWNGDTSLVVAGSVALLGGGAAGLIGPGLQLGGAMRMRGLMLHEGVDIDPKLGWVGWGLQAGSVAGLVATAALAESGVGGVAGTVTAGAWVGSIAVGAVFRGQVVRIHDGAFGMGRPRALPRVIVAPRPGGVTLIGAF